MSEQGMQEKSQLIKLVVEGTRQEMEDATHKLSQCKDPETVSLLNQALRKAMETARSMAGAYRMTQMFGSYGRETTMDLTDRYYYESTKQCENIATVLAKIGTQEAFEVLFAAYRDGLKSIEPQIRKFGKAGERAVKPRSFIDRMLGLRRWAR
jgi:hypothetical protein